MIIGNHSAGKSSFINWYVEEDIQKSKTSIETIEINVIMHGKSKQEFNGFNAIKVLLRSWLTTQRCTTRNVRADRGRACRFS